MNNEQYAPAAPDSLEHLPSHHCAVPDDIKTRLREHDSSRSTCLDSDMLCNDAADQIEALERQLAEASKGHAMYEHVRTLNPREFGNIWQMNLIGGVRFDDLILADMDKRKGERA